MMNYTVVVVVEKECSGSVSPRKIFLAPGDYIKKSKSSYKTLTYTAVVRYICSWVDLIRMAFTILQIRKEPTDGS